MTCGLREKAEPNGTCSPCPEYTKETPGGKECRADICALGEEVQRDGTCIPIICGPFTRM